jgi:PKD repeat protein
MIMSISASIAQNVNYEETSSNVSLSVKPKNVLLYYGNGGAGPGDYGNSATFYDLQTYYNSIGYPTTYSPTWPGDLNFYKVIFLIMPGVLGDNGTYYFTSSQISGIQGFLRNDRRLVVMGEHSGNFGVNTVNDLLNKVGVGIWQNSDNVLSSITPAASDITSDQLTQGVNDLDMDGSGVSTLALSGSAKSLVRDRDGRDLVAVDQISSSPARPGADVLVFGDTQVLDDTQLRDGDGDGPFDNFIFADNIVNFNGENEPPVADAGSDQTEYEGIVVTLDGTGSYDPDGTIESYEWDFESDGLYDYIETSGSAPDGAFDGKTAHIYGDDGTYTATLRVADNNNESDTDTCEITVNNVAPAISSMSAPSGNEGSKITVTSSAIDRGSDDLTFTWDWGDGISSTTNIYYNDGSSPDPYPSPLGTYPFSVTDSVQHTYGDDGVYTITLTVADDDGGSSVTRESVMINNVAPTITFILVPSGDEGSSFNFSAIATDPGSDDLTFSWDFEYGPTMDNIYYNNGIGPDPDSSPLGVYPFSASDTVTHSYGDDYNYNLILTVTDDDSGVFKYTTTISIDNVAPSIIELAVPYIAYEGTSSTYKATAKDLGSDDLTFEWDFGDSSPVITNPYYNDGAGADPYPSPEGTFPFTGQDILDHTYGDDYNYTLSLKVTDDDGGVTTLTTTVIVNNVAPTIESFGPFLVDENTPLNFTGLSTDLGSDDLTFSWGLDYGPTYTNIFYNDGVGPDSYPSPRGTYPFSATDHVSHTYGDNGVFLLTLTVKDDDGGATTYTTNITVKNVEPVIEKIEVYINVNISLRVAGEKYHSVDIYLYEDDSEFWSGKVTRYPGSPDEQKATVSNVKLNITKKYTAKVDYLPNDPRINGNVWGANPVWIIMTFEDGSESRLHHTFNVRKSYWNDDHWNHIDPWEVELSPLLEGHNLTLEAQASDIGSDDLTFTWSFGNVTTAGPTTYYNNGVSPDPYPSPEINPMTATDISKHFYTISGTYTIILTVEDDDGAICVATLTL